MPEKLILQAQQRTVIGKKVRALRHRSLTPANISSGHESVAISVSPQEFAKLYAKVGETGLFYVSIEGETEKRPVLVVEVQVHPVTNVVIHITLRQVSLKEKVSAEVPVVLVGELGVRDAVAVLAHAHVEVEALPLDLPEKFEIDLSELTEIGQIVSFADLKYDREKVVLKVSEEQLKEPVVLVQEVKEEVVEEVVVAPVEGAEGAATGSAAPGVGGEAGATASGAGSSAPGAAGAGAGGGGAVGGDGGAKAG